MRIELYFTIKNYRTHLCALALSCVRNVHVACAVRVADRDAEAGNASRSRGARQSLARPTLPLRRAATRQAARGRRAREVEGRHGSYGGREDLYYSAKCYSHSETLYRDVRGQSCSRL